MRIKPGDLTADGALLAGNNTQLNINGQLVNSGGIFSKTALNVQAGDIDNQGTVSGQNVILTAQRDLSNQGGRLIGGDALTLTADNIRSASTLTEVQPKHAIKPIKLSMRGFLGPLKAGNLNTAQAGADDRHLNRIAGLYVQNKQGQLTLTANNNITLTASQIANQGQASKTQISAGNDLQLATLTATNTQNSDWDSKNYRHLSTRTDLGSELKGGDITLQAGRHLNAQAANIEASQALTLNAGTAQTDLVEHSYQSSHGMLSYSSVETHDELHQKEALGSQLGGNTVTLTAGHDLNIAGSQVVATNNLTGNDLNITTADEALSELHWCKEKSSGLMGSGGIGITVGKQQLKQTDDSEAQLHQGSLLGSTQGDANLTASKHLTFDGSELIASRNSQLSGQSVNITSVQNALTTHSKIEQKQSGFTVSLAGSAGGALNTAVQTANQSTPGADGRIKALQNVKAALSGAQAYEAVNLDLASSGTDKASNSLIGVNVAYGSSSATSETTTKQSTAQSSTISAGNNLTIQATGTTPDSGNIALTGSELQAGGNLALNATNNINLTSAQNSQTVDGKNESKGSSVGVGVTVGTGSGVGYTVNASVNRGKGFEKGNSRYATDAIVNAGKTLTINSGKDTTLQGAQGQGNQIIANIGGNLHLASEQAIDNYDAKQSNLSAGAGVTYGAGAPVNLNFAASRDNLHSEYQLVQNQTGLFAGDPSCNQLTTGTLGLSDIKNQANYKVEHQGVSLSAGCSVGSNLISNMGNVMALTGNKHDQDSNTTHAALAKGSLTIRNQDEQTQDITTLSRDTANAHSTLTPIFDKQKAQKTKSRLSS